MKVCFTLRASGGGRKKYVFSGIGTFYFFEEAFSVELVPFKCVFSGIGALYLFEKAFSVELEPLNVFVEVLLRSVLPLDPWVGRFWCGI